LFDRDEEPVDISQTLVSKKPPKSNKKNGLADTLQTREDLLESSLVNDDLMYSSAGNTHLNFNFTKTEVKSELSRSAGRE
jgi:hypothetical protein